MTSANQGSISAQANVSETNVKPRSGGRSQNLSEVEAKRQLQGV